MSTEEQQAIKNERRRIRDAQRRQNMTERERRLHNERRRNEYRANQQMCEDEGNMPPEEQRAIERERLRLLMETRRQTMTAQERRLQNEHRRNEYRARQQDQGNMLTEEQHAIERERRRILDANRRQNMTDEEKNLRNERRRNQYRARHHQVETKASSSTSNAPTNLFEHVIHEHVQAEVERLIGRVKTVAINTSKGYIELGPQHRGTPADCTFLRLYKAFPFFS